MGARAKTERKNSTATCVGKKLNSTGNLEEKNVIMNFMLGCYALTMDIQIITYFEAS